jgi:hypothetical protein
MQPVATLVGFEFGFGQESAHVPLANRFDYSLFYEFGC